jgi:hypothetical protein
MGGGDRVIDAAGQALQHAEERERDDHLRENEDGATEFAPQTGPDQRYELHPSPLQTIKQIRARIVV